MGFTNATSNTFPPTTLQPLYRIWRDWCIGDSLGYMNDNFLYLETLINTLSSNMNQIMNVPYARLAELPGQDTAISNLNSITGSSNTNTNQPAQLIFPISTEVTLTRNLTFINTPANYIDTIGITKNGDRSIRFSTTGTYEIYVESPSLSLYNFNAQGNVDIRLLDASNNVILAGTPVVFDAGGGTSGNSKPTLRGRFSITNTSTNYFVQIRRNQAGQSFGLCAAIPDTAGAGVLFTTELWKLA